MHAPAIKAASHDVPSLRCCSQLFTGASSGHRCWLAVKKKKKKQPGRLTSPGKTGKKMLWLIYFSWSEGVSVYSPRVFLTKLLPEFRNQGKLTEDSRHLPEVHIQNEKAGITHNYVFLWQCVCCFVKARPWWIFFSFGLTQWCNSLGHTVYFKNERSQRIS